MQEKQMDERSLFDRRTGYDRRNELISFDIENGGLDKRKTKEDRRISQERRSGWVRDNQWSSLNMELLR